MQPFVYVSRGRRPATRRGAYVAVLGLNSRQKPELTVDEKIIFSIGTNYVSRKGMLPQPDGKAFFVTRAGVQAEEICVNYLSLRIGQERVSY